jgi:hypothetical protein
MRRIVLVMMAFISGSIIVGVASQSALAAPLPQSAAGASAVSTVETVGYWKRYCRYNDCTGAANVDVVVPAVPAAPVVVPAVPAVPAPVVVPQSPPVIAVVPVRPVSCGEFHYWNGSACVDARYNNPYIGPR